MNKNSFNTPFFTDPNYMEKKMDKEDKFIKKVFIVYIIAVILSIVVISFVIVEVSSGIEKEGGLFKSIGKSINEIKQEIK